MVPNRFLFYTFFLLFTTVGFSQYAEYEWEERDDWMDVSKIFELANIGTGSLVADIGCHEGYLTVRLSKRVGESGGVYAVDVRDDRLETLRENLEDRNIKNVEVVLGDYDDPKLPMATLDAIFIMDAYHEIADYMKVLDHIHTALKPGGRILVLEKLKDRVKDKSREDQIDSHTLSSKYVKEELQEAGFLITKTIMDFGRWEREENKTMWILVAKKQ
jgi:ubiquinone/menaquinone biosynthesis C-methylase UbiE